MINDAQLAVIANTTGIIVFTLIVVYHYIHSGAPNKTA